MSIDEIQVFRYLDKNNTNTINKEDLINAFEIFDQKKTGKCSSKELFHALSVIGEKLTEKDIENIKSKIKIEKNGLINYKELINIFLN